MHFAENLLKIPEVSAKASLSVAVTVAWDGKLASTCCSGWEVGWNLSEELKVRQAIWWIVVATGEDSAAKSKVLFKALISSRVKDCGCCLLVGFFLRNSGILFQ